MISLLKEKYNSLYKTICGSGLRVNILHFQFLTTYQLHPLTKKILAEQSGDVLDFGCEHKPYKVLYKNTNRYIGADIVAGPDVDVVIADENIPIKTEDGQFDSVLTTQVLEHTFTLNYIREFNRLLKNEGEVLVSVPFIYQVHHDHDYRRFTKKGLVQEFENAGFELVEYHPCGGIGSTLGFLFLAFINTSLGLSNFGRALKLITLPLWLVLCLCVNVLGVALDYIDRTGVFYNNQVAVFKKVKEL